MVTAQEVLTASIAFSANGNLRGALAEELHTLAFLRWAGATDKTRKPIAYVLFVYRDLRRQLRAAVPLTAGGRIPPLRWHQFPEDSLYRDRRPSVLRVIMASDALAELYRHTSANGRAFIDHWRAGAKTAREIGLKMNWTTDQTKYVRTKLIQLYKELTK